MPQSFIYGLLMLLFRCTCALEKYNLSCQNKSNLYANENSSICAIDSLSMLCLIGIGDVDSTYNMIFYAAINKRNFNNVDIDVEILDKINNKSECNISDNSVRKPHSRFSIGADVHNQCMEMGMTQPLLYTIKGCYEITISPYLINGTTKYSAMPYKYAHWVNNPYEIENFKLHPTFTTTNSEYSIDIQWLFQRNIKILKYDVNLILPEIYFKSSAQILGCKQYSKTSINVTKDCNLTEFKIKCTLSCLPNGNYSVRLNFGSNPQCSSEDGIFNMADYCRWEDNFDRIWFASKALIKKDVLTSSFGTYIMISVLIPVVVLVCGMVVTLSRSKVTMRKPIQIIKTEKLTELSALEEDKVTKVTHINGIFLLYARDCSAFMDLMLEFRKFLADSTGCQIYDLFDDNQFNEIAKSPYDWVQRMVEDNSIRVVLVATEIGEMLHQSLIKHFSQGINDCTIDPAYLLYQNPNFIDAYIVHAIKLISINVNTYAPYQKYYICRIPSVIKNMDFFQHINPFKRYDLPHALNILAENITKTSIDLVTHCDQYNSEHRFLNSLNDFKKFVDENPAYIKQIILPLENSESF